MNQRLESIHEMIISDIHGDNDLEWLLRKNLEQAIKEEEIYWKKRGRIKSIKEVTKHQLLPYLCVGSGEHSIYFNGPWQCDMGVDS